MNVHSGSWATTVVSWAFWFCWPFSYEMITYCNLNMCLFDCSWLRTFLRVCVRFRASLLCKLPGHDFCLLFYYSGYLFLVNLQEFLVYYILTFCECYSFKISSPFCLLYIDFVQTYLHWTESLNIFCCCCCCCFVCFLQHWIFFFLTSLLEYNCFTMVC